MATVRPFADFKHFAGINNVNDRLSLNVNELTEALNVDIDINGIVKRRKGYAKQITGAFHSLFSSKLSGLLAVTGGNLVKISDDFTGYTIIKAGVGDERMNYADTADRTVLTNGLMIGYIKNSIYHLFTTPTLPNRRVMPAGNLIEYYNGRIYTVRANVIYYSIPMKYGENDSRTGFIQMNDRVTMLKSVSDGLYTSDGRIKFIAGGNIGESIVRVVADYGVIENTARTIDASYIGGTNPITGKVVFMVTERGFAVGMNQGQFMNLTENRYSDIVGITGTSVQRKEQFLTIIEA